MQIRTVEVGELISSLSATGVQRHIAALQGVHHVSVNYIAGRATMRFDETKTSLGDIRQRIIECGYHCRGEMLRAHACAPEGRTGGHALHERHAVGHSAFGHKGAQQICNIMHDMGHWPGNGATSSVQ